MEKRDTKLNGILWGILILLIAIGTMYAVENFTHIGQGIKMQSERTKSDVDTTGGSLVTNAPSTPIIILKDSGHPATITFPYSGVYKINQGSSLTRDWIVLNDTTCPVQLTNTVGIITEYLDRDTRFVPTGKIEATEPITAYEIHHILYDVFGEHLVSLSNVEISDINGSAALSKSGSWYATDNQISEYFTSVSYVATVRTKAGKIWNYNPIVIITELNKIEIVYKENYRPSTGPLEN